MIGAPTYKALVDRAVNICVDLRCSHTNPRDVIADYSMSEADLTYILAKIPRRDSVLGVHVGNFIGVSLAYFASRLSGLLVTVDPGEMYQGLAQPDIACARLIDDLRAKGELGCEVAFLRGFSLTGPPNRGGFATGMQQLSSLAFMMPQRADFVILDTDSQGVYLESEMFRASQILRTGGQLIVQAYDPAREATFEKRGDSFTEMYDTNGRVCVAQRSWKSPHTTTTGTHDDKV